MPLAIEHYCELDSTCMVGEAGIFAYFCRFKSPGKQATSIYQGCLHNSTYLHFTELRGKDYSFVKKKYSFKEWGLFTAKQASPCKRYSYTSEVKGALYIYWKWSSVVKTTYHFKV
jgi:hypothetical protein